VELDLLLYPAMLAALFFPTPWLLRRHEPLEALAVGGALAVQFWGVVALGRFLVAQPPAPARTAGLLGLAAAVSLGVGLWRLAGRAPSGRPPRSGSWILLAVAGGAALTLGLEASLPHYADPKYYFDWWMHFDLAGFYRAPADPGRIYLDGGTVTSRTPLFNLLGSLALIAFGDRFPVFQVFTASLGWLWLLPFALLAHRLFSDQATRVVALVALSPLVLYSHTYSWPKGLVAFLALMALERFVALSAAAPKGSGGLALQFGMLSGAAVMTHAGFAGYVLPLFLLAAEAAWRKRRRWSDAGIAVAAFLLVVLPWSVWAASQYGWQRGLFGYPQSPYASVRDWLWDCGISLVTAWLPVSLPLTLLTRALDPLQSVLIVYLGTAAGLLGGAYLFKALAQNLERRRRAPAPHAGALLAFSIAGILVATAGLQARGVQDSANVAYIPGLLVLTLLALRTTPLTARLARLAATEAVALHGVLLAWLWSPASDTQGNLELAFQHHIRFLADDAWPIGLALALAGVGTCIAAARLWPPRPWSRAAGAVTPVP